MINYMGIQLDDQHLVLIYLGPMTNVITVKELNMSFPVCLEALKDLSTVHDACVIHLLFAI